MLSLNKSFGNEHSFKTSKNFLSNFKRIFCDVHINESAYKQCQQIFFHEKMSLRFMFCCRKTWTTLPMAKKDVMSSVDNVDKTFLK
ncbi:unnamed protein product [Rotaria magnacalcarata]